VVHLQDAETSSTRHPCDGANEVLRMVYVPPLKSRHRRLDMPTLRGEQQSFSDDYGLRIACLERANAQLPNASPDEVVREAQRRYDALSAFLTGSASTSTINDAAAIPCPHCEGKGEFSLTCDGSFTKECEACGGKGKLTVKDWNAWRDAPRFPCPRCVGTGEFSLTCDDGNGFTECCKPCGGEGKLTVKDWNAWCDFLNSCDRGAS